MRYAVTLVAALGLGATALGHHAPAERSVPEPVRQRCVVLLHGKGGEGDPTEIDDQGVATIRPSGNAEAWGGWEWRYFPDDSFAEALTIVQESAAACDAVLLGGFSNGAAFAAKLFCRGETLDGRLLAVVVDDPVPDGGVIPCTPDPTVAVTLYWTGALDETAQPGWTCAEQDWTCEGGTTIGIDAYAEALGTGIVASPHDGHEWFLAAPELSDWRITPSEPPTTDT